MIKPSRTSLGSWLALAVGLLAGASLVWFVGPLLVLRGWRPLEGAAARALVIALMLVLPLAAALWRLLQTRRLARRAAQSPDALDTLVDQALLRLRTRPAVTITGWRGLWARWQQLNGPDPLLALPWVLVIGLPGADQRRGLAAAGYELPLRSTAEPPCTWCITPQGVLIDVAEDLLTTRQADWLRLLGRLQQVRPLQPVSAVLLMLPASERAGQLLADLAAAFEPVPARLVELVQITGMVPPLHLAVTGCERLAGFPGAELQQRLQAAVERLPLTRFQPRPAAVLGRDPSALRRLIDLPVLAPVTLPPFAERYLRRQRWLVGAGYAGTVLVLAGLGAGWTISREQNLALIAGQQDELRAVQAALDAARPDLAQDNPGSLLPALDRLQDVANTGGRAVGWTARLGLYQGDKLQYFAEAARSRLLREGLAPVLLHRLADRMRELVAADRRSDSDSDSINDSDSLYDDLRLYLGLLHDIPDDDREDLAAALKARLASLMNAPQVKNWSDDQWRALSAQVLALVADGGAPAQVLDAALVSRARERLNAKPLAHWRYHQMQSAYRAAGSGQLSVRDMLGDADAQWFSRPSGTALTLGVPLLFSVDGASRFVAPVARRPALAGMRQVLGLAARPGDAQATEDSVRTDALKLYGRDYAAAWDALLADLRLARVPDSSRAAQLAGRLTAADSPVLTLVRTAVDQANTVGRILLSLDASSQGLMNDHFAALQALTTGQPLPLSATLAQMADQVKRLTAMVPIDSKGMPTAPLPRPLLPTPLQHLMALYDGGDTGAGATATDAGPSAVSEFSKLQQQCQRSAANRYPLVARAKTEMTLADFAALFGAGSGFDAYFRRWLTPLVDVSTRPWSWRPGTESGRPLPTSALASFEQASYIGEALFIAGTQQPSLSVTLSLLSLAAGNRDVKSVELRVNDEQSLLAAGGGSKRINWPGPPPLQRIALGLADAKATALNFEGSWALLRLMDGLTLQPTRVPSRYFAKLPIGGLAAELTLITASAVDLSKAQLRDFRCPAAADPKGTAQPAKASLDGPTVTGKVAKDAVKQLVQQSRR